MDRETRVWPDCRPARETLGLANRPAGLARLEPRPRDERRACDPCTRSVKSTPPLRFTHRPLGVEELRERWPETGDGFALRLRVIGSV